MAAISSWNPAQYLKFHAARLRPALDLLNRATAIVDDPKQVKTILDLGCGPGNITPFLANAFPNAHIEGVDASSAMIDKANKVRQSSPLNAIQDRIHFRVNTIEEETRYNKKQYDLVYCNASLHWCLNHDKLFPEVIKQLVARNGGIFAVQMPDTRNQESHVLMEHAALRTGLIDLMKEIRIPRVEKDPHWYYQFLSPLCKEIDMWSAEYVEQLSSDDTATGSKRHPVHEFTRGTGLLPIIEGFGGESSPRCQKYLAEYDRLLGEAYPSMNITNKYHAQGKNVTLFPFKRFFFVCKT